MAKLNRRGFVGLMTLLTLVITLQLTFGGFNVDTTPISDPQPQESKAIVVPYNQAGMPVKVNTMVADNRSTDAWLEYSITNVSNEKIVGTYLRVFMLGADGKLITEDGFSGDEIGAGTTIQSRIRIQRAVEQNGLSIATVTKVIGRSGVWKVDPPELERAVGARINHQPDVNARVDFEPNTTVTNVDRSEIFKLILDDVINDDEKAERLKDRGNVIVLNEHLHFEVPQIPNVKLSILDQEEIQRIADKRGRVIYLIYRPFVIEGASVLARISLRDEVARRPGVHVPFKFTYLFTCVKKDGRWSIEKSLGYAQS